MSRSYYSSFSLFSSSWQFVLGLILAIIATILLYVFVFPKKREGSLNGFLKALKDFFDMKYLLIEKITKFVYILCSIYIFVVGFFLLFGSTILFGLLFMIVGPIVLRLSYEMFMLVILLVRNVMEINAKLKGSGKEKLSQFDYEMPSVSQSFSAPQAPAKETGTVCPNCGKKLPEGALFCNVCGTKIEK
ncbi:MAG: zinc-ribbon domain-containing protein [Lachnospiraceae bacterium]|nr:zinc-ribbon domain-containing protein [Lachnospiraceae bacterium]